MQSKWSPDANLNLQRCDKHVINKFLVHIWSCDDRDDQLKCAALAWRAAWRRGQTARGCFAAAPAHRASTAVHAAHGASTRDCRRRSCAARELIQLRAHASPFAV
eukprot:6213472-Pleurochrysis_carterae.AAC.2